MIEHALVKILGDPDGYAKYRKLIKKAHVTRLTWEVIDKGVDPWYDKNPSVPVDWASAHAGYLLQHGGSMDSDSLKIIESLFLDSPSTGAPPDDVMRVLNERAHFDKISVMARDIAEGEGSYEPDDVQEVLKKYYDAIAAITPAPPVLTAGDILRATSPSGGLAWGLKELRMSVGNINKGNLILVAARSEVGKTAFLVDQAYGFLTSCTDKNPLLYVTNEDPGHSIELRFMQRHFHVDGATVLSDMAKYQSMWVADMNKKLLIVDNDETGCATWDELLMYVEHYKPTVLIVDQLRNLRGFEGGNTEIERLAQLYKSARSLSKNYCPIIVAHQADATAHNVMYPQAVQLEGTKTEVQGALDVQIMLGRDYDMGEWVRGMHIVKNKCGFGPEADFKHRHGKFELVLDPLKQHYTGAYT